MQVNTWEYLCSTDSKKIKNNGDEKTLSIPLYETTLAINKSLKKNKELVVTTLKSYDDMDNFMNKYVDDLYEISSFHNIAELLQFVSPQETNKKEWGKVMEKLNKYNDKISNSLELFNKLKYIRQNNQLDKEEIFFLDNILTRLTNSGIINNSEKVNKASALKFHHDKLVYEIIEKMLKPASVILNKNDVDTTECLLNINQISEAEVEVIHDKNMYNNLVRIIKTDMSRKILERSYFMLSKNVLKDFIKLIMCRYELAKQLKYENYAVQIVRDKKEIEEAEEFLGEMMNNMNDKYMLALEKIYSLSKTKLKHSDILHYISKIRKEEMTTRFTVNNVLNIIFNVIKLYFGIRFEENKKINGWDKTVKVYNAINEKNIVIGTLYVDLLKRNHKSITTPAVFINNRSFEYPMGKNNKKSPNISLIASYDSLDTPLLTIKDYIYLFKQFAKILVTLCDSSKFGLSIFQINKELFMEKLFEWISIYPKILDLLNINSTYRNDIISSYEIENILDVMNNSVDASFDILINTSDKFINLCKKLLKEKKDMGSTIEKVYQEIYTKHMKQFEKYLDTKFISINPNIIYNITDNNNRMLYQNLYDKITAFNLFNLINKNGCGIRFRVLVLEDNSLELKYSIHKFFENEKNLENKQNPTINKKEVEVGKDSEMNRFED